MLYIVPPGSPFCDITCRSWGFFMKKTFKVIAYDTREPQSMIVAARSGEAWRIGGNLFLEIGENINAKVINDYSWNWNGFSAFEKLPTMPLNMVAKVWMDG